ncbi:hypothetical protein [Micromonospora aurantiaca (nom. illeg.)]|uniref:hypothetical protein n=1 Tax=Micromonospora aurantiaca (nom. illeg.) TaxID=47850 RepID=UPI0033E7A93C
MTPHLPLTRPHRPLRSTVTPYHLHATAAAWSLHDARQILADLARDEAAQIAAERLEAPSVLHSPAWGRRHALGGHGDPTPGMAVLAGDRPAARRNRWAEMRDRLNDKLAWLAGQMPPPPTNPAWEPIERILARLPWTQPGTAAALAKHLQDEDHWVREAIGIGPGRAPLIGVPCPHCGERQLVVQTTGPADAWTVICATGRLCTGHECGCGMPGAVEGVAHIWRRDHVLRAVATSTTGPTSPTDANSDAVAGAAPTRPTN